MSKMNYSSNHSRSLSRTPYYSGNEGRSASCIICQRSVVTDGKDGRRAKVDPAIKRQVGYKGSQQAWVCDQCCHQWSSDVGQGLRHQLEQEALAAVEVASQPYADAEDEQTSDSSFWKWVLAVGVVVVGVVTLGAL